MLAVSCDIIIDKDDKFSLETLHFSDHFVDRTATIGLSKEMGNMAEVTLVRTTPGRLDTVDGHVGLLTKKIEPRMRDSLH